MIMNLFLRRLLHPPPFSFSSSSLSSSSSSSSSSIHRLLSTATTHAPPPNPHFSAVNYLIQSCGFSSDEALRASKKIDHLKSPHKPDAVLRFLRQIGIAESDIRTAVFREPFILHSSVENNWRPDIEKLKEVGFPMEDISAILSRHPCVFQSNFVPKIDFFMRALGSLENLSVLLRKVPSLLCVNLENILVPIFSFLQDQLGLPVNRIILLARSAPFLFTNAPQSLSIKIKRAEELGIRCSSGMFLYALIVVSNLSQDTIDARLNNLKYLGFSQEEVTTMVRKQPLVLKLPEEIIARKIKFLIKEVGCDKLHVVHYPTLLQLNLEKRLIPRNLVRKLLESKGFPVAKINLFSFGNVNEKLFMEKFIHPYEYAIPGLHQAYIDACSGKTSAKE